MLKKFIFHLLRTTKLILVSGIIVFFSLFAPQNSAEARSGCCSWHSGVCGCDTSVGRQVCCDGTYSPSCTCTYIPKRTPIPIPVNPVKNATWIFTANNSEKNHNVIFSWSDTVQRDYSISISKIPGADPGPVTDTNKTEHTFTNISSGIWYLNLKAKVNGIWSKIVYWKIDVPEWVEPTPSPTPSPSKTPEVLGEKEDNSETDLSTSAVVLTIAGFIIWLGIKILDKLAPDTENTES